MGVTLSLERWDQEVHDVGLVLVEQAAQVYTAEVRRLMEESPRGGRLYRRGLRLHKASAPGEPPAPDTRALIESIAYEVVEEGDVVSAYAGSRLPVEYAAALEFGTQHVAPRPAWRPALAAVQG